MGSLTGILLYSLSKALYQNKEAALLAFLFLTIYTSFIKIGFLLLTETLFTFFLIIVVLFHIKFIKEAKGYYFYSGALLLGFLTLCRPYTLFLPLAIGLTLYFLNRLKRRLRSILIYLAVFLVCLMPWIVRNLICFNKFTLLAAGSGLVFWAGTDFYSDALPNRIIEGKNAYARANILTAPYNSICSPEADGILWQAGFRNISSHPFKYLKLCGRKMFRFLGVTSAYGRGKLKALINLFLLLTFIGGVRIGIKSEWRGTLILLVIIFYSLLFHTLLTFAQPRFALPILPLLFIFSSLFITKSLKISFQAIKKWTEK
jgi:4-amino-4-deoxy-L-arabinose transferase-like glycosyltransferase